MKIINLKKKTGTAKEHSLTIEERKILEKEIKNIKHRVIYYLGCYAGLRVQEISQCRWNWIQIIDNGNNKILEINIPNIDNDSRNAKKQFQTKNRESRTTYILDTEIAVFIYTWFSMKTKGVLLSRIQIYNIVHSWNIYIQRPVNTIHPHCLRATAQNIYKFEYNLDDIFIQLCFGWKDMKTVMNHYRTMNKQSGEMYLLQKLKNE